MSAVEARITVDVVVPGPCSGRLVFLDRYISFFGEVDPETGCFREEPTCIGNVVLAFRGTRGSTVAPYVVYALKKNEKAPVCMLVEEVEPMLVVGCVLADIPLYRVRNYRLLESLQDRLVEVVGNELRARE